MADTLILGTTIIEDKRATGTVGVIWSTPGSNFITGADQAYAIAGGRVQNIAGAAKTFYKSVELPNGATITKVIVYSDGTETWSLKRETINGTGTETMATAAAGTEEVSIIEGLIDNNTYKYWLQIAPLNNEWVHGARIIYTT